MGLLKHLYQIALGTLSILLNSKSTLLQCVTETEQKRSRVSAIGRNLQN